MDKNENIKKIIICPEHQLKEFNNDKGENTIILIYEPIGIGLNIYNGLQNLLINGNVKENEEVLTLIYMEGKKIKKKMKFKELHDIFKETKEFYR